MRRPSTFLLALLLALAASGAAAQLRAIPADAQRGKLSYLQDMQMELDGKPILLTPGAQIRDTNNLIVMPGTVAKGSVVRYQLDLSGQQLNRVWILSDQEAAASAPPPPPAPAPVPTPAPATDPAKAGGS